VSLFTIRLGSNLTTPGARPNVAPHPKPSSPRGRRLCPWIGSLDSLSMPLLTVKMVGGGGRVCGDPPNRVLQRNTLRKLDNVPG